MFLDEARLAARIQHPNVVSTLDVVALEGELFLVMDYVQGESLARLVRKALERGERVSCSDRRQFDDRACSTRPATQAHEARSERGEPPRESCTATSRLECSDRNRRRGSRGGLRRRQGVWSNPDKHEGQLKGKGRLHGSRAESRANPSIAARTSYAASVVLWETLAGRRLFDGDNPGVIMNQVIEGRIELPSRYVPGNVVGSGCCGHEEAGARSSRAIQHRTGHGP